MSADKQKMFHVEHYGMMIAVAFAHMCTLGNVV